MAEPTAPSSHPQTWSFGPVQVWLRAHVPGTRGEPQAREVLGQHFDLAPSAVPMTRDEHNRPWLLPPLQHYGAGWSHSGEHLLLGLGEHIRLGVDLERVRARPRLREVVQRFFHTDEIDWLGTLPDPAHDAWFFRLWCAKEAVLKAHGHGLSFGLHRLSFRPGADGALQLGWCDAALGQAGDWTLHEWLAAPDYRAAVAWHPLEPAHPSLR